VVIAGIGTDSLSQYRAAVQPTLDLSVPATWAKEKFPTLLSQAPLKIVLSHAGLKQDRGIFEFLPEGTLVAGAHDHTHYVEQTDRMTYFHSGSWNSHLSEVQLKISGGSAQWKVSQRLISDDDRRDVELMEVIRTTEEQHLSPDDLRVIGRTDRELVLREAARYVVRAVLRAAKVDAVFIGNTTFGGGLPGGEITHIALDACVRFDGKIFVAEITGERLRSLLRDANQDADTPFRERQGEFQFAEGPSEIASGQTYRIGTTDWGVRNRMRYFGTDEIEFVEQPSLKLKAIVAAALARDAAE
jgi:2',3'-cyclic-nucleotide 2'-phosphodiesterase (5'-nucleotidase family)